MAGKRWRELIRKMEGSGTVLLPDGKTFGADYEFRIYQEMHELPVVGGPTETAAGTKRIDGHLTDPSQRIPIDGEFDFELAHGERLSLFVTNTSPFSPHFEVAVAKVHEGFRTRFET